MNIERLVYLSEVAKSGSFLIASQMNFVSESVIRQSINKLENELGFKLFKSCKNSKVVLTIEGLQLISLVKELLIEYRELEQLVKSIKNNSYSYVNVMYDVSVL
ncbi:LysR family transcriptional regulator [Bacillus sp. AFS017336]|uniref:LysR family transcriptional regulator n=1 Tax=Bacillus sp. AFS017336 TaxID=2033489 RepID=UPI0015CF5553|nr:LysR family transcriptional regulator [Bacillus sp. AFS017336]